MNRTTMALLLALAVTSLSIARGSITVDQSPPSTPGNGNDNYSLAFVSYSSVRIRVCELNLFERRLSPSVGVGLTQFPRTIVSEIRAR